MCKHSNELEFVVQKKEHLHVFPVMSQLSS